jgi:hypothetical protein
VIIDKGCMGVLANGAIHYACWSWPFLMKTLLSCSLAPRAIPRRSKWGQHRPWWLDCKTVGVGNESEGERDR